MKFGQLTLIWVGFLVACFEVEVGGGKITPPPPIHPRLKLVRIILETWNLVRKFTPICSFRKYTFQCQGPLHFVDVGIFLQKISIFFGKNGTFTQSNSVTDVYEIF